MAEVTRDELDGFGRRLNTAEVCMGKIEANTDRNSQDIQILFEISNKLQSKLPLWIIGSISIPTLLVLYQILSK